MSIWFQNPRVNAKMKYRAIRLGYAEVQYFQRLVNCREDITETVQPSGINLLALAEKHLSRTWMPEPFDPESLADVLGAARALLPFPNYEFPALVRLMQNAPRRDGATPQVRHPC
jgi:hypothetical protein